MIVYLATLDYEYEGNTVIGIYSSTDKAKTACETDFDDRHSDSDKSLKWESNPYDSLYADNTSTSRYNIVPVEVDA